MSSSTYKGSIEQRYIKDELVVCVRVPVVFKDEDEWRFNEDNFKAAIPLFETWHKLHPKWILYVPDQGERARAGEYPADGRIHVFKSRMTAEAYLKPEEELVELGCEVPFFLLLLLKWL